MRELNNEGTDKSAELCRMSCAIKMLFDWTLLFQSQTKNHASFQRVTSLPPKHVLMKITKSSFFASQLSGKKTFDEYSSFKL